MFLQNGQPLQINQQTLTQRMKNGVLDWTVIRTSPQATAGQNMACFVPSSQKGQIQTSWGSVLNYNGVGVSHGKGDFIVCGKLPNGQPNLADRWVVNGEIFATTYNNQGWAQCLSNRFNTNITINNLPPLAAITHNQLLQLYFKLYEQAYAFSDRLKVSTDRKSFEGRDKCVGGSDYGDETWGATLYPDHIHAWYMNNQDDVYAGDVVNLDSILCYNSGVHSGKIPLKKAFNIDSVETVKIKSINDIIPKGHNHATDSNYGSRAYWQSLDNTQKENELNNPKSPYYCGGIG